MIVNMHYTQQFQKSYCSWMGKMKIIFVLQLFIYPFNEIHGLKN